MAIKYYILTLFPEMFSVFNHSIIGNAIENKLLEIHTFNIRDFTIDKHRKVDDYPYGGGCGMVMTPQPIVDSIRYIKEKYEFPEVAPKVIFLGPRGKTFNQNMAKDLSKEKNIIFLCGHYEGIDERVYKHIDMEISLGDFVLTGGEMAAIPIIDAISRMVPDVLSSDESYTEESFYNGTLEYPQYTRPSTFEGTVVPDVLLSGHHENINKWRKAQSLVLTSIHRKDLFDKLNISNEDKKLITKSVATVVKK
jgi:tRNA (guanine37-N1)-methyltransferase